MSTHYEVLGVAPDASPDEMRERYRALARDLHPDRRAEGAPHSEEMARVNAAWAVLRDPVRRREYDRQLTDADAPPDAPDDPLPQIGRAHV